MQRLPVGFTQGHGECPLAASLRHFDEDFVHAGFQINRDAVLIHHAAPRRRILVNLRAIQPYAHAIVASDAKEGFRWGGAFDVGKSVPDAVAGLAEFI